MSKYYFKITQYNSNFRCIDNWEEWISDNSKLSAVKTIQNAYPESEGYNCELINTYD